MDQITSIQFRSNGNVHFYVGTELVKIEKATDRPEIFDLEIQINDYRFNVYALESIRWRL